MNLKLNELLTRSLSGLLFVVLVIGAVFIHPAAFVVLFLAITILSLHEFYKLASTGASRPYKLSGIIAGAGIFLLCFIYCLNKKSIIFYPYFIILLLVIAVESLFRKGNRAVNLMITLLGILYVALPLSLLNLLLFPTHLNFHHTPHLAAGYFFLIWSFDTGAYITGKPLGKHKMIPVISPAKSWEGFAGGILIAAMVCYPVSIFYTELSRADWYVMLLTIVIWGTAGDLFESVLKRNAGVKDSGKLMPGHGGMLDRFDSVFLSLPVFVIYYLIKYRLDIIFGTGG